MALLLALSFSAGAMYEAEPIDAIASTSGLSKADSKRAARTGRIPQTGKDKRIAARNVVRFKAGSDLSRKVN